MSDKGTFEAGSAKKSYTPETKSRPIDKIVPPKEELVTMTKEQLDDLKKQIMEETMKQFENSDYVGRMKAQLERDSAIRTVEAQGQFADPALKVIRSGSLAPIDHQEAVVAPYKTDPSKVYRVINKANDELHQLRRHQGYELVRDESNNEVRYMDGVLAEMPRAKYDETIGAQTNARKMLKKQAAKDAAQNYIEMGRSAGFKMTGDGVKIDVGKP